MPARDGFPAGVPAWIDIRGPDPQSTAAFYSGLFGWSFEDRSPAGSDTRYLVATLDGKAVAGVGSASRASSSRAWNTYIAVDSADATAAKVRDAGGSMIAQPFDLDDLARIAVCSDPSSAVFGLWQPGTIKGAQAVNAPGSWNFSELNTRDVDAARPFYGAVFGWEANEVDMGAMAGTMVRLPGYADFLETYDPGVKQRHADFGAPAGFSDCVAWMLPLRGDEMPHWNVTFAVVDADTVAARAKELGGEVVVEPFDIAPVRSAVLRDPAGARFTVNAFKPG